MTRSPQVATAIGGCEDALLPPVDDRLLARIAKRIADRLPDACVVLFGSRARGRAHNDSDIDLLIITEAGKDPHPVTGELYGLLSPRRVSLDLIVLSPSELRRRIRAFDPFLEEVVTEGRVLHGRLPN